MSSISSSQSKFNTVYLTQKSAESLKAATSEAMASTGKMSNGKQVYQVGHQEFKALTDSEAKELSSKQRVMLLTGEKVNQLQKAFSQAAEKQNTQVLRYSSAGREISTNHVLRNMSEKNDIKGGGQSPSKETAKNIVTCLKNYETLLPKSEEKVPDQSQWRRTSTFSTGNRNPSFTLSSSRNSSSMESSVGSTGSEGRLPEEGKISSSSSSDLVVSNHDAQDKETSAPKENKSEVSTASHTDALSAAQPTTMLTEKEKIRSQVIDEMVTTEKKFSDATKNMIQVYSQLAEKLEQHPQSEEDKINAVKLKTLVDNLKNLNKVQSKILSGITSWDASKGVERHVYVADILNKNIEQYGESLTPFVLDFEENLALTTGQSQNINKYEILNEPEGSKLDVNSFLTDNSVILPIQRMPRWVLLTGELSKHTPDETTGATELKSTLEQIKTAAQKINSNKSEKEATLRDTLNPIMDEILRTEQQTKDKTKQMIDIYSQLADKLKEKGGKSNIRDAKEITGFVENLKKLNNVQIKIVEGLDSWTKNSTLQKHAYYANTLNDHLDKYKECALPLILNEEKYIKLTERQIKNIDDFQLLKHLKNHDGNPATASFFVSEYSATKPRQQITQWPKLVDALINKTPEVFKKELNSTKMNIKNTLSEINEAKRKSENSLSTRMQNFIRP